MILLWLRWLLVCITDADQLLQAIEVISQMIDIKSGDDSPKFYDLALLTSAMHALNVLANTLDMDDISGAASLLIMPHCL